MANRLVQPMKDLAGTYGKSSWPGYKFKELLGYTTGRHTGVDYNGPGAGNADIGYGAYAIGTGKILKVIPQSKSPSGFGNTLIYELTDKNLIKRMGLAGKRVYVRYMHLSRFLVKEGQNVAIGQRIAEVGNTGTVWAHLHADMWHSGNGLGAHLEYHKDTQLASYLDIYKTVEKYKTEPAPTVKLATEAEIKKAYLDILERPADAGGIRHYKKYTIAFVRDDLMKSNERARLLAKKAADAKKAAEAKKKAEEAAAAEKAKSDVDKNQDKVISEMNTKLSALSTMVDKIVQFLSSVFKGWK